MKKVQYMMVLLGCVMLLIGLTISQQVGIFFLVVGLLMLIVGVIKETKPK
ncbi:hypothetical protein [Mammaliicoccus sp. Dog046]|nr:hypothetical protein [Mammaliicoccus sp. Dog046]WQK84984.1 hypothetical protein P3U32_10175 [Mammaliicoccus sp. Dog046]